MEYWQTWKNCPCCNNPTFAKRFVWDICYVCGWEDDPEQETDSNASHMSLADYIDRYSNGREEYDVTAEQFELAKNLDLVWIGEYDGELHCNGGWKNEVRKILPDKAIFNTSFFSL